MSNCETCKNKPATPENIPYIAHELEVVRIERTIKRLWITTLILIFMLVGTNAAWLYYESQWETVYQEVVQEADNGTNNFVGGDLVGETDN